MSLIYNGIEIKKLVYNNTEIKESYYNGTKIYTQKQPEIMTDIFFNIKRKEYMHKVSKYEREYYYYFYDEQFEFEDPEIKYDSLLNISPRNFEVLIYTYILNTFGTIRFSIIDNKYIHHTSAGSNYPDEYCTFTYILMGPFSITYIPQ